MYIMGLCDISKDACDLLDDLGYEPRFNEVQLAESFSIMDCDDDRFLYFSGTPATPGKLMTTAEVEYRYINVLVSTDGRLIGVLPDGKLETIANVRNLHTAIEVMRKLFKPEPE